MLLVCCFCDKVCDDTMRRSQWQHLHLYIVSRSVKREDTILSYTCCHGCLQGDPHAIAFRARQSDSGAATVKAAVRLRRSVAA